VHFCYELRTRTVETDSAALNSPRRARLPAMNVNWTVDSDMWPAHERLCYLWHAGEDKSMSLYASAAQTSGEAIAYSDAAIAPSTSTRASRRGDPGSDASSGRAVANAGV
jgi:hypothetical protein